MEDLVLLSPRQYGLRIEKIRQAMMECQMDCIIISSNANLYYLTGRVFSGWALLCLDGDPIYFVKRPTHLMAEHTITVRKPESMPQELKVRGIRIPGRIGLELSRLSWNMAQRIINAFAIDTPLDANVALSMARSAKTAEEIALMEISGKKQVEVYRQIPSLYHSGMTDIDLQIDLERADRKAGCLGQFRVAGEDMELFMGNILAGDNADAPSPYDFAMGGAGADPSLPVGANGTVLKPGMSVMVDLNANFTGYMTDMTRTFKVGSIDELALLAHQTSIDICHAAAAMARPGVEAKEIYEMAMGIVKDAALEDFFMGHRQHAGFIGHGVGIEINEWPVISPRSKDILALGNAIALEPKFVIPGTGAVGIENTYIVTDEGTRCITNAPEEIISLQ